MVVVMHKKGEYEEEIDKFVETALWEIIESQRNTLGNIF